MLDLKLKESEEHSLECHIKLLNKQMEYAHAMQQFGGVTDSTAAGPLVPNLTPFLPTTSLAASPAAVLLPTTFLCTAPSTTPSVAPSTTHFNTCPTGFPTTGPSSASYFQSHPHV